LIQIDEASASDFAAIDQLLDQRFGLARRARTAYRLRDGLAPILPLCVVAREGGVLVGSAQCWPLRVRGQDGTRAPLVLLGPVAVALSHERAGLGSALTRAALARADAGGFAPQLLIGDLDFYGRFGFAAGAGDGWELPGPVDRARLLLRGDASALPQAGWLEADVSLGRGAAAA
jgi:predicted N-acetyltransferase YhbS